MFLGWMELLMLSLLLYPLSFIPLKPGLKRWYTKAFRLWCKAWVDALGIDLRLHQHFQKPLPKQYILIANHPSAFEDIGIPSLFPVHSLAKIEVKSWPIAGRISAASGTLYVHRESKQSRKEASAMMLLALEQGQNIALYPEGGIKGKHLHDHFRYGVFDLSLKSGIPILPVFLHYEAQDDFYWGSETLPQKIRDFMLSNNNRANYHLYDAFDPKDYQDKESYCQSVYEQFLIWQKKYLE
jgi:1-acyl-sn-glycerol-3-phosphate acyltransferase